MILGKTIRLKWVVFTIIWFSMLGIAHLAQASTETILHSFTCSATDGCKPQGGLILDSEGNLYGTTQGGGANGGGTVFKLAPSGDLTILHSFACGTTDGCDPGSGVVLDSKGNLYGTTWQGGADGNGTVFEVSASGTETILHSFTCGTDGCSFAGIGGGGLVLDKANNLHGTTFTGGFSPSDCGTVFKLIPSSGKLTTLYSFSCGLDGGTPVGGIALDKANNLYGTTSGGGAYSFGTVFKVAPSGKETVLHSFNANGEDGFLPYGGVILDSKNNLYGTTYRGGAIGAGTIFEVTASDTETVLYSFTCGTKSCEPEEGLAFDKYGNLYGTTQWGGLYDLGTVFEWASSGVATTLHTFADNGRDGYLPPLSANGPAIDSEGNLYGTTSAGGANGGGTVFKIVP
jgi:uncharacterized repeat protein (TIGR03803 family)